MSIQTYKPNMNHIVIISICVIIVISGFVLHDIREKSIKENDIWLKSHTCDQIDYRINEMGYNIYIQYEEYYLEECLK